MPNNKNFKDRDDIIVGISDEKCLICGKPTPYVEICSEAHFCCQECMDKFYNAFNKTITQYFEDEVCENENKP